MEPQSPASIKRDIDNEERTKLASETGSEAENVDDIQIVE